MISAKIICDSISSNGIRMTTMEIEYPRFILAELNTHRMLSKNSASSRAIPVNAMHKTLNATPVYWGKNQPGMQAAEELNNADKGMALYVWSQAKDMAVKFATVLATELGVHKQIANRVTEPWMMMKTVISGTEWANFFHLRNHKDAQPEIRELAKRMHEAMVSSNPTILLPGEWHLPYVHTCRDKLNDIFYRDNDGTELSLEDARKVSASCCAQVSYRKNDDSLDKAKKIYKQLIESTPAHASPVEHQATPMKLTKFPFDHAGVTHIDCHNRRWSGNLQDWVQFRKLIPNEAVWGQVPGRITLDEEIDSI
jgi:thymidylate synthase ThyX